MESITIDSALTPMCEQNIIMFESLNGWQNGCILWLNPRRLTKLKVFKYSFFKIPEWKHGEQLFSKFALKYSILGKNLPTLNRRKCSPKLRPAVIENIFRPRATKMLLGLGSESFKIWPSRYRGLRFEHFPVLPN